MAMNSKADQGVTKTEPPVAPATAPAVAGETIEKPKRYIVGLDKKCPFDYITIPTIPREGGAFVFQKVVQKPFATGDGMMALSGPTEGAMIEIYADEYAKIVEYLTNYGVNWNVNTPDEKRPEIVALKPKDGQRHNRRDVASGNIEPLSKYAYIVPAREVTAEDQEASNRPPTLLELERAKAPTLASK